LASIFCLDEAETKLVAFFYAYLNFGPLEGSVDKLLEWDTIRRLAVWAGIDAATVVAVMRHNGTLMKSGLALGGSRALRLSKYGITFSIDDILLNFLRDGGEHPLASYLLDIDTKPVLPMESFDLSDTAKAAAAAVMQAPSGVARLLLYGKPGTGKTEFTRALCSSLGLRACFIRQKQDDSTAVFMRLNLASKCVDPERDVLVIDEADDILNVEPGLFQPKDGLRKSLVNELLDAAPARMIFITNQTWRISDSILRRMSYHLEFEDFTFQQRLRLWNRLCSENATFARDEVKQLASRYKANPSRIRQVVDICSSSESHGNGYDSLKLAKEMLARSDKLMYRKPIRQDEVLPWYDPMALNLSLPVDVLVSRLGQWRASFDERKSGLNLLFHGAPGTGKTAFAAWLAERLGMYLVIKKASDLLDMFVGGTEGRIRDAFREAEGTMLVIDEADSFLADRSQARYSWERTMTNEVLTQMEGFKGMFVAATNFNTVLDPASLRRFAFKLEFKPLEAEMCLNLLARRFPDLNWSATPPKELDRLAGLTPGDIATVALRMEYAGEVGVRDIVAALHEELACRSPIQRGIGFCQ
jgi:SpoVK/Ycf46/Vps4 family AAA+-type ATPase